MTKLYTFSHLKTTFHSLKGAIIAFMAMFLCANSLVAQGSGTKDDPYILEDGKTYTIKPYKDFYAQFIVPEDVTSDGVFLELVANDIIDVYTEAEHLNRVSETTGNFSPYTSSVKIKNGTKKGSIYYVYCDFPMNGGDLKVSYGGGTPTELAKVSPDEGTELHASYGLVTFEFTKNIKFQQCVLIMGGAEKEIVAYPNGKFVTVDIKEELIAGYKNNTLKVGNDILVQLRGVTSEDGKTQLNDIIVKYKAGPEPLMLETAAQTPGNGLDAIASWMSTQSPEGLVVLTFNNKVSSTANITAELSYGNMEAEDPNEYYVETVPVTRASDNTLHIDLRGKVRTPQSMVASGQNYGSMLLTVKGIEDEFGYKTYSEGSGAAGAYFFNYNFVVVDYSLLVEFTPAKGSCIDNVENLEVWILETDSKMEYSGVTFTYTHQGQEKTINVDASNLAVEADPEDENAVYVRIPFLHFLAMPTLRSK